MYSLFYFCCPYYTKFAKNKQKNRQLGGSYREIIMKKKSFRISKQS
ncbi:protein of unknown function [Streptococcus sanguinis]|uniref:Uncharacterized protein n=1 Tax=Streptococcus sanguinis TaxID=1305 RepID=A0A0B7GNQ8_STRSA|nr:protein of unknown function [Streptococcus sanguinis]